VFENDLTQALFSILHEAGRALYEQLEGTPKLDRRWPPYRLMEK